jgi:hypothetical protein
MILDNLLPWRSKIIDGRLCMALTETRTMQGQ